MYIYRERDVYIYTYIFDCSFVNLSLYAKIIDEWVRSDQIESIWISGTTSFCLALLI